MTRWDETDAPKGNDYDERWARLAAAGEQIHGEADLVERLLLDGAAGSGAGSVLDAGCGTGRVGIELAARGVDVVGVDLDAGMLATARAKAPAIEWHCADLAEVDLDRTFDVVVAAGNVMIFLAAGTEATVVERLAGHVRVEGLLVTGFQVSDRYPLADLDRHGASVGLGLVDRWSTWDREPFSGGDYAVSVHRRT